MKFNVILLFCLCFTSGLLTASSSLDNNTVDAQELLVSNADDTAEALPIAFTDLTVTTVDDEICYSASIGVNVMGITANVTVSGCGATSAEAWGDFVAALRLARNEQ
jgi:hypothetical protein